MFFNIKNHSIEMFEIFLKLYLWKFALLLYDSLIYYIQY